MQKLMGIQIITTYHKADIIKQNNCERIWTTKFTVSCVKTVYVDKLKVHIDGYILAGYRKNQ